MARMHITNMRQVGKYFTDLALDPTKIPNNVTDIKARLKDNGVNVDDYDQVEIVVDTDEKVTFVIRQKNLFEEGLARVNSNSVHYAIHPDADGVYRRFYLNPPDTTDTGRKQELFDIRVGDYVVSSCM